jgi:hypothetical protein
LLYKLLYERPGSQEIDPSGGRFRFVSLVGEAGFEPATS